MTDAQLEQGLRDLGKDLKPDPRWQEGVWRRVWENVSAEQARLIRASRPPFWSRTWPRRVFVVVITLELATLAVVAWLAWGPV